MFRELAVGEAEALPRRGVRVAGGRLEEPQDVREMCLSEGILEPLGDDADGRRPGPSRRLVFRGLQAPRGQRQRRFEGPLQRHVEGHLVQRRLGHLLGRRPFEVVVVFILSVLSPTRTRKSLVEGLLLGSEPLEGRRGEDVPRGLGRVGPRHDAEAGFDDRRDEVRFADELWLPLREGADALRRAVPGGPVQGLFRSAHDVQQ
mmetsp:Transcript_30253/g.97542  ORF Transcript_30253/g.97542 Transcript_30253/m.97542 type:complete len:203 (+) Transcript_30253:685-1293(+)